MEMHQVRYFLSASKTLNFTRAAEQCHVSQPALTAAIKKLELEMGNKLFHREGRRLLLSEFGAAMRPHLEQVLEQTHAAQALAENFRLLRQVPVRLGVLPTIGPTRLSHFLATFQQQNQGVEIAVHEELMPSLWQKLEDGEIDLAITSTAGEPDDRFRNEQLYEERYVVITAPDSELAALDIIRLSDLSEKDYVDRLACELREMVMGVCDSKNVKLYAKFRSEREDWVQGMVLARLGFAFMPEHSITVHGLVSRPLVEPEVTRRIMLSCMPGRQHPPSVAALVTASRHYNWLS